MKIDLRLSIPKEVKKKLANPRLYREKQVKFYRVDYFQIYENGWLDLNVIHELSPQGQVLDNTARYCSLDYIINVDEKSDKLIIEYIKKARRLDYIIDQITNCLKSLISSLNKIKTQDSE
jgi:hypothetical protein